MWKEHSYHSQTRRRPTASSKVPNRDPLGPTQSMLILQTVPIFSGVYLSCRIITENIPSRRGLSRGENVDLPNEILPPRKTLGTAEFAAKVISQSNFTDAGFRSRRLYDYCRLLLSEYGMSWKVDQTGFDPLDRLAHFLTWWDITKC